MDMFRLYYYAGLPLATNLIFYSITSLSTSISSSQNVVKFITEHKDCDSVVFKKEIEDIDLENKLRIVESLVYDIIRKFCVDKEEFEKTKKEIQNPSITDSVSVSGGSVGFDFALVEVASKAPVLDRIDEPIKLSVISVSETLHNINEVLVDIRRKINSHQKSYVRNFVSLSLKNELHRLNKQTKVLDIRTNLLLDLLKIYLPFVKRRK
jgi:hypothetical protein